MIGKEPGQYVIEAELGVGGMGTVYRATGPDGVVALKTVHPHLLTSPGYLERFRREAEIGRKVDHANVVRTLAVDAADDRRFLVMEYVEGQTLRQLLAEVDRVPVRDTEPRDTEPGSFVSTLLGRTCKGVRRSLHPS